MYPFANGYIFAFVSCGTLTFISRNNTPPNAFIKFTGMGGSEVFTDIQPVPNSFFAAVTEYPNSHTVTEQNGRTIFFDNISRFLLTKRLRVNRTTLTLFVDNNGSIPYENKFYLKIYHSGVTAYEQLNLIPRVTPNTSSSGMYYLLFESKKIYWIQRAFNFGVLTSDTTGGFDILGAMAVQFEIDAVDTYANPHAIFETECSKIPFDKII